MTASERVEAIGSGSGNPANIHVDGRERDGCTFADFGRLRDRLDAVLAGEAEVFTFMGQEARAAALARARTNLAEARFRIVVMGAVKHGKSTLINALLGEKVVPMDWSVATTAIPISVRFGQKWRALCYERLSSGVLELDLPRDSKKLEDAVTIPEEAGYAVQAHPYGRAEIYGPVELLKNGVEVEDSAGLNENLRRSQLTWSQVSNADAVVLVLDINVVDAESDRNDLWRILEEQRDCGSVFVVWNYVDQSKKGDLVSYERAKRKAVAKVEPMGIREDHVCFLSALEGLNGRQTGDGGLLEGSGLLAFERTLSDFLVRDGASAKLRNSLIAAEDAVDEARQEITLWRRDLVEETERARKAERRARELLADAESIRGRLSSKLTRTADVLGSQVTLAVRSFVDDTREHIDESVRGVNVKSGEVVFEFKASVRRLVRAIEDWIKSRGRSWEQDQLAPLVKGYRSDVRQGLTDALFELERVSAGIANLEGTNPNQGDPKELGLTDGESEQYRARVQDDVSVLMNRIESQDTDMSFLLKDAGIGAAVGAIIALWVATMLAVPLLGLVVLGGAALGSLLGFINAGDMLKDRVVCEAEKALKEGRGELEERLCETFEQGCKQVWSGVRASLDKRFAAIKARAAAIKDTCSKAEARAADRQASAAELLERLDSYKKELVDLRQEIDPLDGKRNVAAQIRRELKIRFAEMEQTLRRPNGGEADHGQRSIAELKAVLKEEVCLRFDAVRGYFEKTGRWKPAMERQILTAWAWCRERIGRKAFKQEPVFRIVTAIAACEGETSIPEPEDVKERYADKGYRADLLHLSLIVISKDYAEELARDEVGTVGKEWKNFCLAYRRALETLQPERTEVNPTPSSVIHASDREPPKWDD